MIHINLKVSCFRRAQARRAHAQRVFFLACEWDEVAFKRDGNRRFCSARCAAAFETDSRLKHTTNDHPRSQPADLLSLYEVHHPRGGRPLVDLSRQDQRRGLGKHHPVDMGPRGLALEMRTFNEANFRPTRRLLWIDTNLAVAA